MARLTPSAGQARVVTHKKNKETNKTRINLADNRYAKSLINSAQINETMKQQLSSMLN